jgi:hypothetical protein
MGRPRTSKTGKVHMGMLFDATDWDNFLNVARTNDMSATKALQRAVKWIGLTQQIPGVTPLGRGLRLDGKQD